MTDAVHPASSAVFLSRLHDAELSAAEAAEFDRHRAVCEACRETVAQFERSLTAFRTAPTTQAPSDLSARILRKIRAQSPSRRPFGVMFGIDIRWAGVFMAALLVAIIAPALFFKREAQVTPRAPETISAYVVEVEPDKGPATSGPAPARPRSRVVAQAPAAAAEEKAQTKENRGDAGAAHPAAPPQVPSEDELAAEREPSRQLKSAAPATAAKREALAADRSGGEAGAIATEEPGAARVRLEIRALDGSGQPPPVAQAPSDARLVALRGQEFVVIVETGGSVRAVTRGNGEALQEKDAPAANANVETDSDVLRELRFQPGGRPRRLLIKIE